jgi:hypothetical protein
MTSVQTLIEDFTQHLTSLLESQAMERARNAVESALGVRRPGRPAKLPALTMTGRPRKKPPVQFCPVPGCKNPAAPVFGMVCAKHKDVPKTKIKKYREARRAKQLGGKMAKAQKRKVKKAVRRKPVVASQPAAPAAA